MRNTIKVGVITLGLASMLSQAVAQSALPDVALQPGWNSIQAKSMEADVTYLASDELQGRLALTEGNEKAIQWIKNEFQKIGLKPVGSDGYLQAVPLIHYVHDDKKTLLSIKTKDTELSWSAPDVISKFEKTLHITGEVVFAGYGITAPDLKYDDYQNIDVKGKIVLIFDHEPQENNPTSIFNGVSGTKYSYARIKALNAQRHGAIAVLLVPEPNRTHLTSAEIYARIGSPTAHIPVNKLVNDDVIIPLFLISKKVADTLAGSEELLSALQSKIDQTLKAQSINLTKNKITLHNEVHSVGYANTYNVMGLLEGSDPKLKKETIIISAHHDHDGSDKNMIWHGADDNASGSAGVLELARALSKNVNSNEGLKLKRSVLFVVFGAEERGLLGSIYMAKHPVRSLVDTKAMINFDMIGRNEIPSKQTDGVIDIPADTDNRLNLIGNNYSPDYENIVTNVNQSVGLELDKRFNDNIALNVYFRSDHFPFADKDIPAFWWFTGFHPDYHQTTDTSDKLNYSKMEKIIKLAYLTTYRFANDEKTPVFVKNPKPAIVSRS